MKIGDRCFVHGYVDEIRKDVVIIKNKGGYFGTDPGEVITVTNTAHPNWIPCSERLPEKNCRCLTTNTAWGAFEVDFNVWINGEWLYPNEKPIAWMPLPEPYKEDDHETD